MSIPGRDVADIRPGTWPEPWQGRAACLGVPLEVFFLDAPASARAFDHAREICAACPVIAECRVMTDRAERGMSHSRLYRFVVGRRPSSECVDGGLGEVVQRFVQRPSRPELSRSVLPNPGLRS